MPPAKLLKRQRYRRNSMEVTVNREAGAKLSRKLQIKRKERRLASLHVTTRTPNSESRKKRQTGGSRKLST